MESQKVHAIDEYVTPYRRVYGVPDSALKAGRTWPSWAEMPDGNFIGHCHGGMGTIEYPCTFMTEVAFRAFVRIAYGEGHFLQVRTVEKHRIEEERWRTSHGIILY